ncbi:MAG: DUF1634 domain-containing protein [Gemmatimonadota bacterium]
MTEPEVLISRTLRIGVILSVAILVLGTLVSYFGDSAYLLSAAELDRLHQPGAAMPQTIGQVLAGVSHLHGPSIISLGLLVLIATPVARVVMSILIFLKARDRLYVAITSCVFLLLLFSFLIGGR